MHSMSECERDTLFMTLTANGLSTAGSPNGLSSKLFDMIFYADFHNTLLDDALCTKFTYLVSLASVHWVRDRFCCFPLTFIA